MVFKMVWDWLNEDTLCCPFKIFPMSLNPFLSLKSSSNSGDTNMRSYRILMECSLSCRLSIVMRLIVRLKVSSFISFVNKGLQSCSIPSYCLLPDFLFDTMMWMKTIVKMSMATFTVVSHNSLEQLLVIWYSWSITKSNIACSSFKGLFFCVGFLGTCSMLSKRSCNEAPSPEPLLLSNDACSLLL